MASAIAYMTIQNTSDMSVDLHHVGVDRDVAGKQGPAVSNDQLVEREVHGFQPVSASRSQILAGT